MSFKIIKLRDHPCNLCHDAALESGTRLAAPGDIYRCRHGFVAVPYDGNRLNRPSSGPEMAIEGNFATKADAMAALIEFAETPTS